MKPSAERILTPLTLLRESTSWAAAAAVQDLQPTLRALRANAQAARRELAGGQPGHPDVATTLSDLLTALDHLEDRLALLQRPIGEQRPRIRFRPEREVATAVSMLAEPGAPLLVELDERAPHVTGRPGLIGIATMHLLLGLEGSRPRTVFATRPLPERLRVEVVGADTDLTGPATSIHLAVLSATVETLGGRVDLHVGRSPSFELPLEL